MLLTDGLPEALTPQGEPLGYEALMEIVDRPQSLEDDPSAWLDRLLEDFTRATTTENDDDLTALMLKRCPIPNRALAATRA